MDIWGAQICSLQSAAVKSSLHSSWCRNHFEKGHPKTKAIQAAWEEEEGRRKCYFIFCTANHFYIIPDYATYHSRDCEARVHQARAIFVSTACCTVCALRCLRWKGHSHRLHSISSSLSLHPPLVIQGYEEERLNAFMCLCSSQWHIKKNSVKIKLSSSLL